MNFHTWGKRNVTLIQPPSSPEAMVDSVKLTIRFTASLQILVSTPFNSRKNPCEPTLYIYDNWKQFFLFSKTHPWELSSRAIVVPASTSVARMEQSGDPVSIAEHKFQFQERKLNEKRRNTTIQKTRKLPRPWLTKRRALHDSVCASTSSNLIISITIII